MRATSGFKEKRNAAERGRYYSDIGYRIQKILRACFRQALRLQQVGKTTSIGRLLGCSIQDLKTHLESKFQPGMSWLNHGSGWEIDHIRPCASFDFRDPRHQRACFHYSNLQPLWTQENREKGARYGIDM